MNDQLDEMVRQVLNEFERDGDDYLVQVYSDVYSGYEWLPVSEDLAELLVLLEDYLHRDTRLD